MRQLRIIGAVVIAGLLAASCVGLPLDSSWGDVSVIGSAPNIMLAFGDKIVQVDPVDGSQINLFDANGNVRVDDEGKPRPWLVHLQNGTATHFYTRPVQLDADTLLVADYESKLFEVDPARAEIINTNGVALPGHVVGSPLLTESILYVPTSDAGLVALDPNDYTELWHFTGDDDKGVWAQPLLIDDRLYVSSMN
ncbi:MAG: PQQ-binding-like beta-propeller repeat protein, partial [Anaerolineae bacterium]|nr:PQQ-binding-like beta-propeller repeat protein [Anaerolineae bacterium]